MKTFANFPENYELIDAGGGRKLERWGTVTTIRPEHQAYFGAALSKKEWTDLADWEFIPKTEGSLQGVWKKLKAQAAEEWIFSSNQLIFNLRITTNKHVGLFPEQQINWEFLSAHLDSSKRFLNAFAYTGAASLFGRRTGAEVIHCDSVKPMLDWGRQNQLSSQLDGIKWVHEDALKFIQREVKRGNKYDVVQLDPPAWGLGTKGEKWKLEDLLGTLLSEAFQLLSKSGVLILNTYSPKIDLKTIHHIIQESGISTNKAENSELWLKTNSGKELYYGILTRIYNH
ncbi:class I SAM-dependent methyltransferase [Fluviicola taffensis]|uniref:SAM dependent methyltransferase n=1 Tax=Fluviicola taffensis (strain DSM 16823 / NCIMB 13979 / RW262) TaxID=755732 RepID=F2IBE0_FLUTR|nr:class I SAM-dependent methyltransferase [Fluviicola taffensis]AEA43226.1 SAM dependent methyltransferase [Fluviicola taffensis DSM 16823]